MEEALLLARAQFGLNIAFHILFPTITIGLAWLLVVFRIRYERTRDPAWLGTYKLWVKVFALTFAMGVVTGIVMSFQFGTNWPGYMNKVGNVAGPLLAYEVLTAFFLEATFLGVMLFGWRRVSPKLHFLATCMVALGTLISTFWILAANSWMQTPAGYRIVDGVFEPENWWHIVFNPSFPLRLVHMTLAAFITTCFVIGGISAVYLLRQRHREAAQLMLKLAVCFAAIAVPLQVLVGDMHGLKVREHQPVKLAAIEGHWETVRGASLILFAWPDPAHETNRYEVSVPKLGSLILTHEIDGEVQGLKAVGPELRPPVAPVFFAFRVMVGLGVLMLTLVAWSALQWRRGRLFDSKLVLRAWMLMTPAGFVAVLAGWYTTEIGRQPYVVYGLLRTSQAATAIDAGSVLTSLIVFATVYLFVFISGTYYLLKLLRRGPLPVGEALLHPEAKSALHPLSLPGEPIEGSG